MKNNIKFKNFYVKPQMPEKLNNLMELAQNIWSTWDSDAYNLFSRIDPIVFRSVNHNPIRLLQQIPADQLQDLAQDSGFINELDQVYHKFRSYLNFTGYYRDQDEKRKDFDDDLTIAYLSMEYGLHESLPIYSGGLGVLSGDHLKVASDLGLPLIGFGLLYRYGYFSQKINLDGTQKEVYIENQWHSQPVQKVKDDLGNDLILKIMIRNDPVMVKAWKIEVGKISLYLLDTNLQINNEKYRKITDYLYVSDRETRLLQEIVLAFGSFELMQKLNIEPKIFHLNEGHNAFMILRRLKHFIKEKGFNFEEAAKLIRKSTVFTTHTPVPAGNEEFELKLVKYYLNDEITTTGLNFESFFKFGQTDRNDHFSMSALAIRFSKFINGVSKLHSQISRQMWHNLYPELYEDEVPIRAITNGVHIQSWLSRPMTKIFDRYLGPDYQHMAEEKGNWENILTIPDDEIWQAHQLRKEQTISFIRNRLKNSLIYTEQSSSSQQIITKVLNSDHLIVGFARRFASYKRANLILKDKQRLLQLIKHSTRPVQFVFAGKSHPADDKGKAMIKEIIDFARENNVQGQFVFVENYDMNIARHLVQGVDVWLNNPVKPLEASGTSGMKAGMNGVINLSILDGWWPECYQPENGWAIISGENIEDQDVRETLEANELYDLLENEISQLYYNRDQNGLPLDWIRKMKYSIRDVGRGFNVHRMLRNYLDDFYLPSSKITDTLKAKDHEKLHKINDIETKLKVYWEKITFDKVKMNFDENKILTTGSKIQVQALLNIDGASQDLLQVEFFYLLSQSNYRILPLKFIRMESDSKAMYEGNFKISGAGRQGFNIRIRPKTCCSREFFDYIKWYY